MVTYHFECENCGNIIEKFRFGQANKELWEQGKLKITCPDCGKDKVKQVIAQGSGQFKGFKW